MMAILGDKGDRMPSKNTRLMMKRARDAAAKKLALAQQSPRYAEEMVSYWEHVFRVATAQGDVVRAAAAAERELRWRKRLAELTGENGPGNGDQ